MIKFHHLIKKCINLHSRRAGTIPCFQDCQLCKRIYRKERKKGGGKILSTLKCQLNTFCFQFPQWHWTISCIPNNSRKENDKQGTSKKSTTFLWSSTHLKYTVHAFFRSMCICIIFWYVLRQIRPIPSIWRSKIQLVVRACS